MMIQEFEKMTGIYPSAQLYAEIENAYYNFDGDKVAFCKAYKENIDGIASKIQHDANSKEEKVDNDNKVKMQKMQEEIERLKEQIEREQEWMPYTDTKHFADNEYNQLKSFGRVMTDDEAKDLISDEFGFDRNKIEILHNIPAYEVNRHHMLREVGQIERLPLYEATDWNYVRFNCAGWSYEMVNGKLNPFTN